MVVHVQTRARLVFTPLKRADGLNSICVSVSVIREVTLSVWQNVGIELLLSVSQAVSVLFSPLCARSSCIYYVSALCKASASLAKNKAKPNKVTNQTNKQTRERERDREREREREREDLASINPFAAPTCTISGPKDARTRLEIAHFRSYNTSTSTAMRSYENAFTCQCENEKALRVMMK